MAAFRLLESVAVPIARANLDTDQLLPARFIQKPRANDFGAYLLRDLRDDPDFVLNRPEYLGARIVVAGRNFACGSSREHAVWALWDYGIRAVVAPSFGDIFHSNALKNGLLPVVLAEPVVAGLIGLLEARPGIALAVDLEAQVVRCPDGTAHGFEIAPFPRHCLLNGLDELGYTLSRMDRITEFERTRA
jgi:3-isopropylmalate/(R)-2-methylmalate dehydratase small subunit